MIFLTIGTHEPFDRLVRAFDDWCAARRPALPVFGQIAAAAGSYRPRHFDWVVRLSPADYAARVAQTALLVSHAGMGSILTALSLGRPIVVMPRRGHLRETRNDHQYDTARRLAGRPGLYVAADEAALGAVLDTALADLGRPQGAAIAATADPAFTAALRAFLLGGPPPPR